MWTQQAHNRSKNTLESQRAKISRRGISANTPHKTRNQYLLRFKRLKYPLTHQYDQVLMQTQRLRVPSLSAKNWTLMLESTLHSRDRLRLQIIHTTQTEAVARKISIRWAWAARTTQRKSFKLSLWVTDWQNQRLRRVQLRLTRLRYSNRAFSTKIHRIYSHPPSLERRTSAQTLQP